jgi:hemerythrin-like domain-containing protein
MESVQHRHALASDALSADHRVVETALTALEKYCDAVARGVSTAPGLAARFLRFFRVFADQAHHAKEEGLLFEKYEERGMPRDQGPIAVMLYEHDEMRGMLASFETADRASDREGVVEWGRAYVVSLRHHILKEDNVLYPMGNRVLRPTDQTELLEAFAEVDRSLGLEMVNDLRAEARRLLDECSKS